MKSQKKRLRKGSKEDRTHPVRMIHGGKQTKYQIVDSWLCILCCQTFDFLPKFETCSWHISPQNQMTFFWEDTFVLVLLFFLLFFWAVCQLKTACVYANCMFSTF